MKEFGERLRELRTEKNISAKQLGDILKVSDATIIRWENDTMSPKIDYILPLCKYFKVTSDYLLGIEE